MDYQWTGDNLACIATYSILENDDMLNQFDDSYLKFEEAGKVKLSSLPYWGKFGMSAADREGRADQMARKFFLYVVRNYTKRKERSMDTVEQVVEHLARAFGSDKATFTDLAHITDDYFKFGNEP